MEMTRMLIVPLAVAVSLAMGCGAGCSPARALDTTSGVGPAIGTTGQTGDTGGATGTGTTGGTTDTGTATGTGTTTVVGDPEVGQPGSYVVVDTGQDLCYDVNGQVIDPAPGDKLYGQDAQHDGPQPSYQDNGEGTITDLNTGLMWQKTPDFTNQLTWEAAVRFGEDLVLAGYDDWRLPSIKELYSLIDSRGSINALTPYIDNTVFDFTYPDTSTGARIIDAQYSSSTHYLGTTMHGDSSAFGVNFADGRIKSYPDTKANYVRCVRGPAYGLNDFVDNGDGTVTDLATGLMWTKKDSAAAMNWESALKYAEGCETAGYDDWRLPNTKELQSIVDYTRAPDALDASRRGPAIDPIFEMTDGAAWGWTSTTHGDSLSRACYIAFGLGTGVDQRTGQLYNPHGAGCQRSDPKAGDPNDYPWGMGPQFDEIRILNHVRCVRDAN
jgi:hypothetical protein